MKVLRFPALFVLVTLMFISFFTAAFGKLVGALLGDDGGIHNDLEKSHFLWLVSYFLKIRSELNIHFF